MRRQCHCPGGEVAFGAPGRIAVENGAALTGLSTASMVDGQLVWVESYREFFRLHRADPNPLLAHVTLQATGGGAQDKWERTAIASSSHAAPWVNQAVWYVNATTGNDEANAGVASPIKTLAELMRRWRGSVLNTTITIYATGALDAWEGQIELGTLGSVLLDGTPGIVADYTDTVAAHTALNPATPEYNLLSLTALGDWTSHVGKRLRVTTGTNAGSLAWVAKVNPRAMGNATARVSWWDRVDLTNRASGTLQTYISTNKPPAAGDTVVVETLGTSIDSIYLRVKTAAGGPMGLALTVANCVVNPTGAARKVCVITDENITYVTSVVCGMYGCRVRSMGIRPQTATQCLIDPMSSSFVEGVIGNNPVIAGYFGCLARRNDGTFGRIVASNLREWNMLAQTVQLDATVTSMVLNGMTAVFDCTGATGDALTADWAAQVNNTGTLFGDGNSGYGVNVYRRGSLMIWQATKPSVTGTLGDTAIVGTMHTWAEMPLYDVTLAAGIIGP